MVATSGTARIRPAAAGSNHWRQQAACRGEDIELFFGPDGERAGAVVIREERAKQFCTNWCPVVAECLQWAIETGSLGVWGGLTYDERRGRKRNQQRQALRERAKEEV
jgi:WhiB family redox-sensing transcriptional regulator